MSQAIIRAGFESKLATWAAAQSPAIPVAYENVTFTPPTGRYLRALLLPANTESATLDRTHREYGGIFQVSIYMPTTTSGAAAAQTIAAALDTLYGMSFTYSSKLIHLLSPMSPGPAFEGTDRYILPVSAPYRLDV